MWHEHANAGFEDLPFPDTRNLPYVVKSPWTYQFIQALLDNPALEFDAVVIPMRDLMEAAASRCIIERQAIHNTLPWMRELSETWEHFAHTPGGIVFSTTPTDQARLLAVGFHHLLDQVVKADIPIILLSFPRLIEDADYLHRRFAEVLPDWASPETCRIAHAETADRRKVRVGAEISALPNTSQAGLTLHGPRHEDLDRVALQRTLAQGTAVRDEQGNRLRQLENAERNHAAAMAEKAAALTSTLQDLALANTALLDLRQQHDNLVSELQRAQHALSQVTNQRNQANKALDATASVLQQARHELLAIRQATTWQVALRLQAVARHASWAVPVARWLVRPRPAAPAAN